MGPLNTKKLRTKYAKFLRVFVEGAAIIATKEQQVAWWVAYRDQGNEVAKELLIRSLMRWVVRLALRYVRRNDCPDYTLDFVQEGLMGVQRAVEKWNPELATFATYATPWIKQSFARFADNSLGDIRVPVHCCEAFRRFERATQQLGIKLGRQPTLAECAEQFDISPLRMATIMQLAQPDIVPLESVEDVEDQRALKGLSDQINKIDQTRNHERLERFLRNHFSKRDTIILLARFGFMGRDFTLEELGKMFGMTRERVRQIEQKILKNPRFLAFLRCMYTGRGIVPDDYYEVSFRRRKIRAKRKTLQSAAISA